MRFSLQAVNMCFDPTLQSMRAHAKTYHLEERQLRRHAKAMGFCFSRQQYDAFEVLYSLAAHRRAACLTDLTMCDETRQRLLMQLGAKLLPGQQRHAPSVPNVLRRLFIEWAPDASGHGLKVSAPWVSPPTPVISSSAGALHASLFELDGIASNRKCARWVELMRSLVFWIIISVA